MKSAEYLVYNFTKTEKSMNGIKYGFMADDGFEIYISVQ